MSDLRRARSMFPLMPSEVFNEWIGALIAKQGWPFYSVDDSIYVEDWSGILLYLPLAEWAKVTWKKSTLDEEALRIDPKSIKLIMKVSVNDFGLQNPFAERRIAKSLERSRSAREFISSNGTFPGFITGIRNRDGFFQLVDGHHRMGALWMLGKDHVSVPSWIGFLPEQSSTNSSPDSH